MQTIEEKNSIQNDISRYCGYFFSAMIVFYLIITLLGGLVLSGFVSSTDVVFYIVSSFFTVMAIVIVMMFVRDKTHEKIFDISGLKPCKPIYFMFALFLAVGMFFGAGCVNLLVVNFATSLGVSVKVIDLPLSESWQLVVFSVLYGILPACFEECFFRGLMFKCLQKKLSDITASLFVAICFALYHMNITQLVYQFIYGFMLCLLVSKAKSVVPCFIAHTINNLLIIWLKFFDVQINLYNPILVALGVGLLVAFLGFLFLGHNKKTVNTRDATPSNSDFIKKFFAKSFLGIFLCVLVALLNLVEL